MRNRKSFLLGKKSRKRMVQKECKTKEIKVIFFFGGFQSKKETGTTRSAKVQQKVPKSRKQEAEANIHTFKEQRKNWRENEQHENMRNNPKSRRRVSYQVI